MALWERLVQPSDANPKLEIHAFMAAMAEFGRGAAGFDRASIIAAFGLRTEDEADLDSLINKFAAIGSDLGKLNFSRGIHDMLLLGNAGIAYTTRTQFTTRVSGWPTT